MSGYLHRQQWLKVFPRSPSPLCYRRLSLPCWRRPPRASTLTPRSPAEAQSNTVQPTWSSYRQSWETWGTSSIRWRVSTSMALSQSSPIPGNHWLCYGFNQGSFVYGPNLKIVLCSSKEIKLLMNELDEEKRIRLTLQVRCEKQRNACSAPARMLIVYITIFKIWQNDFKGMVHPNIQDTFFFKLHPWSYLSI